MPFHRPSFLVSKRNATRKLVNALNKGNIESAKRQLQRGVYMNMSNENEYSNLYNTVKASKTLTNNQKNEAIELLRNHGFPVGKKERLLETKQKEKMEDEMIERARNRFAKTGRRANAEYLTMLERRKEQRFTQALRNRSNQMAMNAIYRPAPIWKGGKTRKHMRK
jgi:hypothetical protein